MRRLPTIAIVPCFALLLAACETMPTPGSRPQPTPPVVLMPGTAPAAHPLARSVTYTCEESSTIVLTEGQPNARVTLGNGLELSLAPSFGGTRYGAPPFEFRSAGSDGFLINNGRAWRCRVK